MSTTTLNKDELEGFKVVELRSFLIERGLSDKGTKTVLIARLKDALEVCLFACLFFFCFFFVQFCCKKG